MSVLHAACGTLPHSEERRVRQACLPRRQQRHVPVSALQRRNREGLSHLVHQHLGVQVKKDMSVRHAACEAPAHLAGRMVSSLQEQQRHVPTPMSASQTCQSYLTCTQIQRTGLQASARCPLLREEQFRSPRPAAEVATQTVLQHPTAEVGRQLGASPIRAAPTLLCLEEASSVEAAWADRHAWAYERYCG